MENKEAVEVDFAIEENIVLSSSLLIVANLIHSKKVQHRPWKEQQE